MLCARCPIRTTRHLAGKLPGAGVKPFRPRDATGEVWRGLPRDETLLVGVAERDIGVFRALYERHAAGTPVQRP